MDQQMITDRLVHAGVKLLGGPPGEIRVDLKSQRLVEMMGNPRTTPAALTAQQNSVDQLDGQVSQLDALLQQTLYVGDTLQPQYFHS